MHRWRAARIVHPFPTLLNGVATVLLALVATRGAADGGTLIRLFVTMVAIQSTIGIVNDLVDQGLDAATKPWKPLPAGALTPRMARILAAVTCTIALVAGMTLGPLAWLLSTAGLGVGLAYDLRLKRSVFSGLTYAIALPLVPLWVWSATGQMRPAVWWVGPLGLMLGGALQIANALPDLEDDAAHGVQGTAQRLGRGRALAVAWGGYGLAILAALLLGLWLGHDRRILGGGVTAAALLLTAAAVAATVRPGRASLQFGWSVLAPGAGILAVAWLAALS